MPIRILRIGSQANYGVVVLAALNVPDGATMMGLMLSDDAHQPDSLGLLDPLLGEWVADGESPIGPYLCRRRFARILDGSHVQLRTHWEYATEPYEELTIFAPDEVHGLQYFSFTSNGEQSIGQMTSPVGPPDGAMVFESLTPAGRIRVSYRPAAAGVVVFAVDSKSGKNWNRLLEHHYRQVRPLLSATPPW